MDEKQKRLLQQTLESFQWLMKALYVRQAKATMIVLNSRENGPNAKNLRQLNSSEFSFMFRMTT